MNLGGQGWGGWRGLFGCKNLRLQEAADSFLKINTFLPFQGISLLMLLFEVWTPLPLEPLILEPGGPH